MVIESSRQWMEFDFFCIFTKIKTSGKFSTSNYVAVAFTTSIKYCIFSGLSKNVGHFHHKDLSLNYDLDLFNIISFVNVM